MKVIIKSILIVLFAVFIAGAEDNISALIKLLQSPLIVERRDAVIKLGELGPASITAVMPLTKTLKDESGEIRILSAEALGEIGPCAIDALPFLIEAMNDNNVGVKKAAVNSIGEMGSIAKSAIPDLVNALFTWDTLINEKTCAKTLVKIGEFSIPAMCDLIENNNKRIVLTGIWCLGEIRFSSKQTLTVLSKNVLSFDHEICDSSLIALEKIGTSSIPVLINGLQSKYSYNRKQCINTLSRMGKPALESLSKLEEMRLRDGDTAVRASANLAVIKLKSLE